MGTQKTLPLTGNRTTDTAESANLRVLDKPVLFE